MLESQKKPTPSMFGQLLQNASMGDLRSCPVSLPPVQVKSCLHCGPLTPLSPQSRCGQQLRMARVLLNSPEIVTIGLVWDSENSDLAEDVIHALGTCLRLGDVSSEQLQPDRHGGGVSRLTPPHLCSFFTGWRRKRPSGRSSTWWAWSATTGSITPPSSSRPRSADGCTLTTLTSKRCAPFLYTIFIPPL